MIYCAFPKNSRNYSARWHMVFPPQTLVQVSRLEPHISMSLTCVTATPHLLAYSCRRHENTGFKSGDLNQRNVSVRPTSYPPPTLDTTPATTPAGRTSSNPAVFLLAIQAARLLRLVSFYHPYFHVSVFSKLPIFRSFAKI